MKLKINLFVILTFGLFGFIFFHLAQNMLQIRPDGWYVGHINLYGDLVFHLTLINKFLESGQILPQSPILAGEKINYPIFADFITAHLSKLTDITTALFLTTFFGGLLTIFVARLFIRTFIKNDKIVFLSLLIFFLNGGLGFYFLFQDFLTSQKSIIDLISSMPRQYTDIKELGFWWINTYLAYFLPQRGFLFAFPITLTVLGLLYFGVKRNRRGLFLLAGLLAGSLPLIQAHSLLLLFLVSLPFAAATFLASSRKRETFINWLIFAATSALVALPLFNTISSTDSIISFIRFDPGWTSQENILWFWLKNLGLFAPILVLAAIWLCKNNRFLFGLYLPFLLIFFLANIFIFQPWDFDNSKLLVYWYFASSVVVAYFLYDQFFLEGVERKITGVLIVAVMIFSGSLDIIRTFTPTTSYQIFSQEDLTIATSVKNLTEKDAIFITSADHNHPIPALAGRSTLLGFPGWVWSHGQKYQQRESDIKKIYQGGEEATRLISLYRVKYVTVGPRERAAFNADENYFRQFPQISLGYDWQIYDVSDLWTDRQRQD